MEGEGFPSGKGHHFLSMLSGALLCTYRHSGDPSDLEKSVRCVRYAAHSACAKPGATAHEFFTHCRALRFRCQLYRARGDLDTAMDSCKRGIEISNTWSGAAEELQTMPRALEEAYAAQLDVQIAVQAETSQSLQDRQSPGFEELEDRITKAQRSLDACKD